jgi:hypothetical protein
MQKASFKNSVFRTEPLFLVALTFMVGCSSQEPLAERDSRQNVQQKPLSNTEPSAAVQSENIANLASIKETRAKPLRFQINDSDGNAHDLHHLLIDYAYAKGVVYTVDFEAAGLRVNDKGAQLTIPWQKLDTVDITEYRHGEYPEKDPSTWKKPKASARVTFVDGRVDVFDLKMFDGIKGNTDLGEVEIEGMRVSSIKVMH